MANYSLTIGETFSLDYSGSSPVINCPSCLEYQDDGGTINFTAVSVGSGVLTLNDPNDSIVVLEEHSIEVTCDHNWVLDHPVDPTCTDAGYNVYMCTICGGFKEEETTAALGHNFEAQYTDRFSDGYGEVCTRCGELGRELEPPPIVCEHVWAFDRLIDPTCTEGGYERLKCVLCGETKTQNPTAALGHNFVAQYTDRFSDGYGEVCTRCGELGEELTAPAEGGGAEARGFTGELHIDVASFVATYRHRDGDIVCGNNAYTIRFTFDPAWDDVENKTARFIWRGGYTDKPIVDGVCEVPILEDVNSVTVGVFGGNLHTTTPAVIRCHRSILCLGLPAPSAGSGSTVGLPTMTPEDDGKVLVVSSGQWVPKMPKTELPVVTTEDNGKTLTVEGGEWVATTPEEPEAELPAVTPADVGKVLSVSTDGAWVAETPDVPEAVDPLPDVTTADNDKVLTVVDGEWKAAEPTGGSAETPVFNLATMGLPTVIVNGGSADLITDTTALMAALAVGEVKLIANVNVGAVMEMQFRYSPTYAPSIGAYEAVVVNRFNGTTLMTDVIVNASGVFVTSFTLESEIDDIISTALGGDY